MKDSKWISTGQMLEDLRNDAGNEHEYSLNIGGRLLTSTHWLVYDSERHLYGHTRDWPYNWYTEAELLEMYAGYEWKRYA